VGTYNKILSVTLLRFRWSKLLIISSQYRVLLRGMLNWSMSWQAVIRIPLVSRFSVMAVRHAL